MTEKFTMHIFKNWTLEDGEQEIFLIQDLFGLLSELDMMNATVIMIDNFKGPQSEIENALKSVLDIIKNDNNTAIVTRAHMQSNYLENNMYELENDVDRDASLHYDISNNESKMLEKLGFLDFNIFVNYEFSKAYIYENTLGKKIMEYILKEG